MLMSSPVKLDVRYENATSSFTEESMALVMFFKMHTTPMPTRQICIHCRSRHVRVALFAWTKGVKRSEQYLLLSSFRLLPNASANCICISKCVFKIDIPFDWQHESKKCFFFVRPASFIFTNRSLIKNRQQFLGFDQTHDTYLHLYSGFINTLEMFNLKLKKCCHSFVPRIVIQWNKNGPRSRPASKVAHQLIYSGTLGRVKSDGTNWQNFREENTKITQKKHKRVIQTRLSNFSCGDFTFFSCFSYNNPVNSCRSITPLLIVEKCRICTKAIKYEYPVNCFIFIFLFSYASHWI